MKPAKRPPSLLIDYRKGSRNLALYEPLRSKHLITCQSCSGGIGATWKLDRSSGEYYKTKDHATDREQKPHCTVCHDTGRILHTLSSGDIAFVGRGKNNLPIMIGVEIKSVTELISSLVSGRLQDTQVRGMVDDYDPCGRWLLHYGIYRPNPANGNLQLYRDGSFTRRAGWYDYTINNVSVQYGYLESFKVSPSILSLGFYIVRVNDIQEAAQWIATLYRTWTRDYDSHKSMRVFDKSQDIEGRLKQDEVGRNMKGGKVSTRSMNAGGNGHADNFRALALQANTLPSMGYERSVAAAKHFEGHSIVDMVTAPAAEWEKIVVEGKNRNIKLGSVKAKSIVEYLNRK